MKVVIPTTVIYSLPDQERGVTQNLVGNNPPLCDRLRLPPGLGLSGT